MPNLQVDVPEGVKQTVDDAGQMGQRPGAGGDLPAVEEHKVDVAVRIELRPAIPPNRHKGQRRELLLRLRREAAFGGVPQRPQEHIENRGPRVADFQAAGAGAMHQFESVRFHLQEPFVAGQLLRGQPARRQLQPRSGARFDLL